MTQSAETSQRKVIALVRPDDITLEKRLQMLVGTTQALYWMRPVYQWFTDVVGLIAQSDNLKEIAPLLAYTTAQSSINPTNASLTLWHMSASGTNEDSLRLLNVMSICQTYRTPDNMSDKDLGINALLDSYSAWIEERNADGVELFDVAQLLTGGLAAILDAGSSIAAWKIVEANPMEVNRNHYSVKLQRWDVQLDLLISFNELKELATLVALLHEADAAGDDDGEQLPEPPAEVIVDVKH